MCRLLILLTSLLFSGYTLAKSTYQIDLILFAHPQNANELLDIDSPLIPVSKKAIPLKSSTIKTDKMYTLLPPSQSGLRDEYYLLNRKSHFRVLGHYSWRQTSSQQHMVALPKTNTMGWLIQGTLHTQEGSYYLFNADLQFSPPSNPENSFTVSQNQRLEKGKVYYLDHPYVGIVVKIHRIT
jgi:hypothetical protein